MRKFLTALFVIGFGFYFGMSALEFVQFYSLDSLHTVERANLISTHSFVSMACLGGIVFANLRK